MRGRYPQEVETAVYFCTLEALQNAAKYAKPGEVVVRLLEESGELVFTIEDDGEGFDQATTKLGSGLQNMADRLAALGGDLLIQSSRKRGTLVEGRVAVPSGAPSAARRAESARRRTDSEERAVPGPSRRLAVPRPPPTPRRLRPRSRSVNRGIANSTAVIITEAAVSPVATVATSSPACVSIRYCTTPPVAAPPGITLLAALLASCDVAIRNHRGLLREIASTSQTQAKLPASSRTIPTNHRTLIVDRWGHTYTQPETHRQAMISSGREVCLTFDGGEAFGGSSKPADVASMIEVALQAKHRSGASPHRAQHRHETRTSAHGSAALFVLPEHRNRGARTRRAMMSA